MLRGRVEIDAANSNRAELRPQGSVPGAGDGKIAQINFRAFQPEPGFAFGERQLIRQLQIGMSAGNARRGKIVGIRHQFRQGRVSYRQRACSGERRKREFAFPAQLRAGPCLPE